VNRRTLAVGILLVWAAVLGWLAKRELFRPRADILAEAALSVPPGATYYRLELGGVQIGYAASTVDTVADTVKVLDQMLLQIPAMGSLQRVEARTEANLTRALRLRDFTATLHSAQTEFGVRGTVSGDTVLQVDIESEGSHQSNTVRLHEPIVLPALLPLNLAFGGELAVGRNYALRMFDPLQMSSRDVRVTVVAESTFIVPDSATYVDDQTMWIPARWDTLHAWKVRQDAGGMTTDAWIDDLGQIVKATTPVGFAMERTAFEIAYLNFRRRDPSTVAASFDSDLIRQTAIASNVSLESDQLTELSVRLRGVTLEGFDLAGGRQRLRGDTLVVRREPGAVLEASYRVPMHDTTFQRWLDPEPLIQSDDPRIQAQARQIVGRTSNPRQAAERLTHWVYETLDKRITISVPSAVEVLESRRGDCNEHTVLYVALARALGLPARTAAGLVYLDGHFYYHAWPEVWLDGWVAVDPTFDQFPADASHLRFIIGGLARQVELIRLVGRLQLDVVQTAGAR
jgi:Transglutaminase-like superfamily